MGKAQIILVEDDNVIAELLEFNLQNENYSTNSFRDGKSLFQALDLLPAPDLFILDLMLPGMDGFEICAKLRENPIYELVPILMLTARSTESDKVRGLETGADDYLTKPFGMRELTARVNALIRRYHKSREAAGREKGSLPEISQAAEASAEAENMIHSGKLLCRDIILDDVRHRVYKGDKEIEMTNREFELLKFLMIHKGVAYSRDDLLDRVWGYEYSGETRTVDVHIRQLRRKIEDNDANPILIETVRGRGYRWTDQF